MNKTIGTVCFIVRNNKVLLVEIEYPDGTRHWNGIGGVVDRGETPLQAVVREISEETELLVKVQDLKKAATIEVGKLELHVFTAKRFTGELKAIDPTILGFAWFEFEAVPYSKMHAGNNEWLPKVLETA